MFKTVVVGSDDSESARQAVVVAAETAKQAGGKLHIVTAYDTGSVHTLDLSPEDLHSTAVHPAEVLLESLAEVAHQFGLEPVVHATSGGPAEAIVKVAEEVGADLIVVGNKGMKGVRRFLGSTPNSVAHKAHCSVLIVDTTGAD